MSDPNHQRTEVPAPLSCRPARIEDAQAAGAVVVAAWRVAYRRLMPQTVLDKLNEERIVNSWRHKAQRRDGFRIVVCSAAQVVGACSGGTLREEVCADSLDDVLNNVPNNVPNDVLNDAINEKRVHEAELYSINVHPQFWGCGAGGLLLKNAEQDMSRLGFSTALLWVLAENHRAQAFYKHCGWSFDGSERTTSSLTGAPLRELCFRKQLRPVRDRAPATR